ncbi:MAG: DUF3082 domain-containing protein [Microcoleaceae cyanobacterium]
MTEQNQPNSSSKTDISKISPFRCLTGSLISSCFAIASYLLTSSVAQTLAQTPIRSGNQYAMQIASAVRTLVIGMCALGTGVFTIAAVGLLALMVQIMIQKRKQRESSS